MKRLVLAVFLLLPVVSMAAFEPQVQPAQQASVPSQPTKSHRPLFQVRYVLESALPKARSMPAIDLGDGKAAIDSASLSVQSGVPLRSRLEQPNVITCRGWGCQNSH
jgi:hypothetical protein